MTNLAAILLIGFGLTGSPPEVPSRDAIIDRFFASMTMDRDFRTLTVTRSVHPLTWPEGGEMPDESQRPPGFLQETRVVSWYVGERWRDEVVSVERGAENRTINFWDGAWRYSISRSSPSVTRRSPGSLIGSQGIFDGMVGRYPSALNYQHYLREGREVETTLSDGVLTHRFTAPGDNEGTLTMTLIADWEPVFRVREFRMHIARDAEKGLESMLSFIVDEWMNVDGIELPRKARRIDRVFMRGQWHDNQTSFEREEVELLDAGQVDPTLFEMVYTPGQWVSDPDLKLSFQVGSREITVDRVIYELAEPLLAHPGDELQALLATAVTQDKSPPRALLEAMGARAGETFGATITPPPGAGRSWVIVIAATAGCLAGFVALGWIIRRRMLARSGG